MNSDIFHSQTCTSLRYSRENEPCDNIQQFCKTFLVCNMTSKTCRPGNIGAFCQSSRDCFLGNGFEEGIRCIDSKCFKPKYNGYSCNKNEEVFS